MSSPSRSPWCSAGAPPARKLLFNSALLATALGAAGVVYLAAGGHPGRPGQVSLTAFAAAALAFTEQALIRQLQEATSSSATCWPPSPTSSRTRSR